MPNNNYWEHNPWPAKREDLLGLLEELIPENDVPGLGVTTYRIEWKKAIRALIELAPEMLSTIEAMCRWEADMEDNGECWFVAREIIRKAKGAK